MRYPSRDVLLERLPVTPGTYETRNGRTAVVTEANESLSDGYLEAAGTAARRPCCWSTRNGWAAGVARSGWDLVKRVEFTDDQDEALAVRQSHSWDEETETCRKCGAKMTEANEVELCPRGVQ